MADDRLKRKRGGKGLLWGLFLLLAVVMAGSFHRLGLSPGGLIRGVRYVISSSRAGGQSRDEAPTRSDQPAAAVSEEEGKVLLRAIEKQRRELQEREESLDRLESRLAREKEEIIRERTELEASRAGDGFPLLKRLSRYLPLLVLLSVVLWLVLVFYLLIRRAVVGRSRAGRPVSSSPGTVKLDGNLGALKESLARMISEVEDLAGRVPDEIRQGSMAMKEMFREADQRMGELRSLLSQVALISQREAFGKATATAGTAEKGKGEGSNMGTGERNKTVYRLAGEGLSEEEIARRLNMGIGEVQLILNLKRTGDERR